MLFLFFLQEKIWSEESIVHEKVMEASYVILLHDVSAQLVHSYYNNM